MTSRHNQFSDTVDSFGADAVRRWSHNPSGFLALNRDNHQYRRHGIDGAVFYREVGRYWIQLGGVFSEHDSQSELLSAFVDHARSQKKEVAAMQLLAQDARIYVNHGFHVNQFGSSYAVDISDYSLKGKKFVKLRNKISRAARAGVEVHELPYEDAAAGIAEIDKRWLRLKGRFARKMEFMVGEVGGPVQPLRRLFVGRLGQEPIGYISYSPVYGSQSGWLHDLSRRTEAAPPGTMEAINWFAMQRFAGEGERYLHFGLTPFTGLSRANDFSTRNAWLAGLLHWLYSHGAWVYPAETQCEYKLKWDPGLIIPDFVAYRGRLTPGKIAALLRAINMI
jgi:lysylphosphatidylglycerol synthetase-like protein (DUF2156 family)